MTDFSPGAVQAAINEKQAAAKVAFLAGLAAAQAEFPTVVKNINAGNRYKYADLHTVENAVRPVLERHGLLYFWQTDTDTEKNIITVTCQLYHKDGFSFSTSMSAGADVSGNKMPIQALGSTVTYLQRYTLQSILGLAVARDDDAAAASKPVSKAQAAELTELCKGRNEAALLERLGIESWSELPQTEFSKTMTFIKAKTKGKADE